MRLAMTFALIGALTLAGCAAESQPTSTPVAEQPSATPGPTPSETAEVPEGASYPDIDALRAGFIQATGESCPPLSPYPNPPTGVICTDGGWQLFWYSDVDARNSVLQLNVDSMEPSPFVVGPNWLINGSAELSEYQTIADAMHATVWTSADPIPAG